MSAPPERGRVNHRPERPQPLVEIEADIKVVEQDILKLLKEVAR